MIGSILGVLQILLSGQKFLTVISLKQNIDIELEIELFGFCIIVT